MPNKICPPSNCNDPIDCGLNPFFGQGAGAGSNPDDYEIVSSVVCNEITNTWNQISTPYVNGVAGVQTIVDLGVSCDLPMPQAPDPEKVSYCNPATDTIWEKVCLFSFPDPSDLSNVVETVLSDNDTGRACNAGDTQKQIFTRCRVDDVNGDGSDYVSYYEGYVREIDDTNALSVVSLGTFTDETLATPYTPTNPTDPSTIGSNAVDSIGRVVLEDIGTFVVPANVLSFTVTVVSAGGTPTFTDSNGVVTELVAGESHTWDNDDCRGISTSPIITSTAGDKIIITYLELS